MIFGLPEFHVCASPGRRCARTGTALAALARCKHKHWSRLEQKEALGDLAPDLQAIDPFAENPPDRSNSLTRSGSSRSRRVRRFRASISAVPRTANATSPRFAGRSASSVDRSTNSWPTPNSVRHAPSGAPMDGFGDVLGRRVRQSDTPDRHANAPQETQIRSNRPKTTSGDGTILSDRSAFDARPNPESQPGKTSGREQQREHRTADHRFRRR